MQPATNDRPAGPTGPQVRCSGCGVVLDALRAGHVAILGARFHYFCSFASCRARYLGLPPVAETRPPDPRHAPAVLLSSVAGADASLPEALQLADRIPGDAPNELIEPLPAPEGDAATFASTPAAERRDIGTLLLALTLIAGTLAMALEFAGKGRLVLAARAILLAVGTAAYLGQLFTARREQTDPNRLVIAAPAVAVTIVAAWALAARVPAAQARTAFLGGVVLVAGALGAAIVAWLRRPLIRFRERVAMLCDVPARRAKTDPTAHAVLTPAGDIRPGEEVVVEAGQVVPVDLAITEGEGEVVAAVPEGLRMRKRVGDAVCAGFRLVGGQLHGTCTWAGNGRALARSLFDPARRADALAPLAITVRRIVERGAIVPVVLAVVYALVRRKPPLDAALVAVAGAAAIASLPLAVAAPLAIGHGIAAALRRGIVYNHAESWEKCARTAAAVFCARGTLLRGEPELSDVERTGDKASIDEVLALGAGALAAERTPIGGALARVTRQRGITPDAVRNARLVSGHGVVAVASTGESVCVGTRALLLERGISIAMAEQRIHEIESAGRSVVLVARGGRLMGVLGLADGLRPGARAAVQHLLDTRIEPILLSADSRQTCEALGRSLDIEHLRPEVPDGERVPEIKRLRETGAVVAVIGHSPADAEPLRCADASVGLGHAGSAPDELSASLTSDEVRDAALALAIAVRTRRAAIQAFTLAFAPAAFGALVAAIGLLPPEYAPLASLLGALAAAAHLWSFERSLGAER